MTTFTQVGGVTVDAFQWNGDPLSGYDLPGWARVMALHAPSDGTLHVPCSIGTFSARPGDWVWQGPDGSVYVSTDAFFSAMFNTVPDSESSDGSEEPKTAAERRAAARAAKNDTTE